MISIVTPCFNGLPWLPLCVASVADQTGVDVEHFVQDGGSRDETCSWLAKQAGLRFSSEPDKGMYDAVNKGIQKTSGEIVGYINCDEQYLPDALAKVKAFFDDHPEIQVAFGGTVISDRDGKYLCHRKALLPTLEDIWLRTPVLTCSVFFRRSILAGSNDLYFDTHWRDIGDVMWMIQLLKSGIRIGIINEYLSVFADTGENMNLKPNGKIESARKREMAPPQVRRFPKWILLKRLIRASANGFFTQKPFSFSAYTLQSPDRRVEQFVSHPTWQWRRAQVLPLPAQESFQR